MLGRHGTRLSVGFGAVVTLLLVVSVRLVQLQGIGGDHYAAAAAGERLRTVQLHGARGTVVDRNGVVMAYTADAKDVVADPSQINCTPPAKQPCQKSDRAAYVRTLAALLGMAPAAVDTKLAGPGQYALVASAIAPSVADQVDALKATGIYIQPTTQRLYPGGTTGGNVVGLVNYQDTGVAGIEQQYDPVLRGKDGTYTYELTSTGSVNPAGISRRIPAVDGGTVHLTLSQDLQYWAQRKLAAAVRHAGARSGQVVVLDVKTANVLAMASTSTFDPQDPSTIDAKQSQNAPIQQVFEPGSVNKIVTFSAALDHKLITPTSVLKVPDQIYMGGVVVHDAWWHPVQKFTATGVLAESSNVGTLKIAQKVGKTTFDNYLKAYGLGTQTGIELPGESRGLLPPMSKWSDSTFANLPIGQGVAMTALQMASMYQTVANGGVRIAPRIVSSVTNPDATVTATVQPAGVRVISPATAKTLTTMLESVTMEGGTGVKAAVPGYLYAGKTGTAQQPDHKTGRYSADKYWDTFAGFIPADAPKFVVAIMVDQPGNGKHAGDVTAPLGHDLAAYELQHERIPPTGANGKLVPLTLP